jgi:archaeal type IV pilus assembly protein PilA
MKQKNDLAVSPVIGVLLMVAVTVILAAIIAMFVFGMAANVPKNKVISMSAQQPSADTITVTYLGGTDTSQFDHATVNVTDDDGKYVDVDNLTNVVGDSVVASGKFSHRNRVSVVGYFTDDSAQVLLETYV